MKNKGFTLVELLAVIVVLSIIALIGYSTVGNVISSTQDSSNKITIKNYAKAVDQAVFLYEMNNSTSNLSNLNSNWLESNVKFEKATVKCNYAIYDKTSSLYGCTVNNSDKKYCYVNDVAQECDESMLIYKETLLKGNDPNLLNNSLTPVVYDESKSAWVVADTTKEWYNYAKQEWANAVILNSGVTKNVGDTVIVPTDSSSTSEVKAMLVWIPRYEYKITGTYGIHLDGTAGTKALPGQIEVRFIPKSQTTADSNYILHPAFTWDDNSDGTIATSEHISGIWVGKFETTGTGDTPTILPNVTSLRTQNISTQFNTSLKLKNYLSTVGTADSHMMKNSEWGAVAYLSQSIYGKYGNTSYTGANKEIYKNDSSSYLTGRSSGTYPQSGSSTSGTCLYNNITDRGNGTGSCGGGASTTGNITGIYDIIGGAYEYTMGYLTTASTTWGSTSNSNDAGFSSAPASKYYDAYISTTGTTACNGGVCKGQALSETFSWYNDYPSFVAASSPWLRRGGDYSYENSAAGIFSSFNVIGCSSSGTSFRTVLLLPGE